MTDIKKYSEETFDSIKHVNEDGQDFGTPANCKACSNTVNGEDSSIR